MDLLRSWAVAVGVWLLGSLITVALFVNVGTLEQAQSFGGRVVAFYLPQLVVAVLMAGAAALVHPVPARERPGRHAVAALAVPAVVLVATLVVNSALLAVTLEFYVAVVCMAVGSVVGWRVADAMRPTRPTRRSSYGYPY